MQKISNGLRRSTPQLRPMMRSFLPLTILSIRRTAGPDSTDGERVDEAALLAEFKRPVGNDPHVVVISGATGTGKSHLVKWLHASADDPKWHVVYIEKRNTSLRRVIETILQDLTGPAIDDLREKLQVAQVASQDLEETKDRLLAELAIRIERPEVANESAYAHKRKRSCQICFATPFFATTFWTKTKQFIALPAWVLRASQKKTTMTRGCSSLKTTYLSNLKISQMRVPRA